MTKPNGDEIILSYFDSLIKRSDFNLLNDNNWLNDSVIGVFYDFFENELFANECKENLFAFVNPSTVQLLKMLSYEEAVATIIEPLELNKKQFIFLPINDNQENTAGGSHWSLLVLIRPQSTYIHYDSYSPANNRTANQFIVKFKSYFKIDMLMTDSEFPQQTNTCDCGVYLIGTTELVASYLVNHKETAKFMEQFVVDFSVLTPEYVKSLRTKYKEMIMTLSSKKQAK